MTFRFAIFAAVSREEQVIDHDSLANQVRDARAYGDRFGGVETVDPFIADYYDKFQELKQLLGTPLPIRQYLDEMIIHYQRSGVLLDEVALALIVRHYDELHLPKDKQIIADKLIRESKAKLQSYWVRYGKLMKDYDRLQNDYLQVKGELEETREENTFRDVTFGLLWILAVLFVLSMISYLR